MKNNKILTVRYFERLLKPFILLFVGQPGGLSTCIEQLLSLRGKLILVCPKGQPLYCTASQKASYLRYIVSIPAARRKKTAVWLSQIIISEAQIAVSEAQTATSEVCRSK